MISIIGAGKMGSAMAAQLEDMYKVQLCKRGETPKGDIVIFAVKPQDFEACIQGLSIDLSEKLIVSIMAGVSMEKIQKLTGAKQVVRSMPNLPLTVGQGLTGWVASKGAPKKIVQELFANFGEAMEVKNESDIDAFTALAGSGPAYFFWLAELMEIQARELGFSEKDAQLIASQTFVGAAETLAQNELSPAQWREAVTSKGGTTHAALTTMADKKLDHAFVSGIEAAIKRSKEL